MERARKVFQQGSLLAAALGLSLVAGSAYATELCHNIGGPRDLGANCDSSDTCTVTTDEGVTFVVAPNFFLGIKLGGPQFQVPIDFFNPSVLAHLAHGDGITILGFDPPLHLASTVGPHKNSNVECYAERFSTTQPPEPGN
jgi:hypothetical protein